MFLSGTIALKAVSLPAVVGLEVEVDLLELPLDLGNEGRATGGQPAKPLHGVAFGVVIGDDQHFSVSLEAVGGAFDEIVRGLPGLE